MNRAILLKSDDWEGLYIKKELVEEGHTLNQGHERSLYFARLAQKYQFDLLNMKVAYLFKKGYFIVDQIGGFPKSLDDLKDEWYIEKEP